MIDVTSQIANVEALLKLMEKYAIDEISLDFINIKKSRHLPLEKEPSHQELLMQHTTTLSAEDAKKAAADRIAEIETWMEKE